MNSHCVDVAYYWTPKEAAAIVDYLDRLRDTVWDMYSDDIIDCRTKELDAQCDPRQQHLHFDDEAGPHHKSQAQSSTPCNHCGASVREPTLSNENTVPPETLPSLDDLPTLSDENIGDMLNLLRTLLHACEEHYKDPIRRLDEQRHRELLPEWGQDLSASLRTGWDDNF